MEVAELKMNITVFVRIDTNDKIRNEYIGGTAHVGRFGEKTRGQDKGGMDTYGGKMMGMLAEG